MVLEPFKASMMVIEMGVKGSGEAKSWLGKDTGVESEIRGTGEKNRGKRTRQEHRARRERREGKQSRSMTGE